MKQRCFFISILSLFSILLSCTSEDFCTLPMTSLVNAGFYSFMGNEVKPLTVYKFSARGNQSDSFYYDSLSNASKISFPLSNEVDTSVFVFTFIEIMEDTIEIAEKVDNNWKDYTFGNCSFTSEMLACPSTFKLTYADSIVHDTVTTIDTIQLSYIRQLYFISYACGFSYNYKLLGLTYTNNRIDSVSIVNSLISTFDEENIHILF
jgi:hypothetical protein